MIQGGEQLFAQKSNGDTTDAKTLTATTIDPVNFTEGGTLKTSGIVQDGRTGTVVANFANGTHQVTLFVKDGSEWKGVGSATSNSSGDASIAGVEFDGPQELFASHQPGHPNRGQGPHAGGLQTRTSRAARPRWARRSST